MQDLNRIFSLNSQETIHDVEAVKRLMSTHDVQHVDLTQVENILRCGNMPKAALILVCCLF